MRIFQVIKDALDEIYESLPQFYNDRDAAIWNAFEDLTRKYEQLETGVEIDYSDAATKFAYLFKYAGSRAWAVQTRLGLIPRLGELFERPSLTVTSLGAGPGSDLLGVLAYWQQADAQPTLEVNLVDGDETWMPTARVIKECACEHLTGGPLPTVRFRQSDLSGERVTSIVDSFHGTNLFTVSYLLSELPNSSRSTFLNGLFSTAAPGTVCLIIDNNTMQVRNIAPVAAAVPAHRVINIVGQEFCRGSGRYMDFSKGELRPGIKCDHFFFSRRSLSRSKAASRIS